MTIKSYRQGPGTVTIGSGPLDISCQITNALVECNVDTSDSVDVLCGEQLAGDDTYTWTFKGNVVQDIDAAGFVAYTWANKGTFQPFKFVPSTAAGRQVSGFIKIRPITLGGDVKSRPQSDFEFTITNSVGAIADPTLGPIT